MSKKRPSRSDFSPRARPMCFAASGFRQRGFDGPSGHRRWNQPTSVGRKCNDGSFACERLSHCHGFINMYSLFLVFPGGSFGWLDFQSSHQMSESNLYWLRGSIYAFILTLCRDRLARVVAPKWVPRCKLNNRPTRIGTWEARRLSESYFNTWTSAWKVGILKVLLPLCIDHLGPGWNLPFRRCATHLVSTCWRTARVTWALRAASATLCTVERRSWTRVNAAYCRRQTQDWLSCLQFIFSHYRLST